MDRGSGGLALRLTVSLLVLLVGAVHSLPAAPASAQGCSWSGTWRVDSSTMTLTQSGNQVSGTLPPDQFAGTVSGNRLTGRWTHGSDSGPFALTMSGDCNSFTGSWGRDNAPTANTLNGTRTGGGSQPPPPPPARSVDLTGLWRDNSGGAVYRVRQINDQVYWSVDAVDLGSFANVFVGTIEGDRIRGRWVDLPGSPSLFGGALTLRIDSNNRLVKVDESPCCYGAREWFRQGSE